MPAPTLSARRCAALALLDAFALSTQNVSVATYTSGNRVLLLRNGMEYFPALLTAIENARSSIYVEAYIFADDASGAVVADALAAAAERGVDVRVVVDGFGSKNYLTKRLRDALVRAGVWTVLYRADVFPMTFRTSRLRRLHRKLVIVDGAIAFVGGINMIDDMNTPGHTPPRIDFAVRVEGPILEPIVAAAHRLWRVLRIVNLDPRTLPRFALEANTLADGETTAKFLVRDNFRYRRHIERAYLAAIRSAKEDVTIASAYFFPGIRFRRELIAAAARGVRVTLLLQGRVEYAALRYASKALYGQLLKGGVRIVEYEASFLHAKVAVVDSRWATVGSSNIDPFSLLLAREANVFVRGAAFASTLQAALANLEVQGGREVEPSGWAKRGLFARALDWMAYGFMRAMIGFVGARGTRW
jgi:cardiolipin synthase A/B